MNGWNNLIKKIWLLVLDIFQLTISLGSEIVLPKKKEKGNLLSTLFLFFIALVEKLHGFEHGAFKMNTFFRNRYIKTGLVLIAGLLFFLTSYEYSSLPLKPLKEVARQEYQFDDAVAAKTIGKRNRKRISFEYLPVKRTDCYRLVLFCSRPSGFYNRKVYLKNRTLLI